MKSKSGKYLDTRYPMSRLDQFRGRFRTAFTLVEVLVAAAIIVTIVSMVYGSYFATAKSTDVYKARMIISGQTRRVLRQMARQIRCSYIGKTVEDTGSAGTSPRGERKIKESPVIFFNYEPDVPGGEILRLVTTNGLFFQEGQAEGLFDVAYKFDRNSGTLSLSQTRFISTPEKLVEKRNWRPLLRNVECIELDFFDGQQWLPKWDFKQKKKLPYAVRIGITSKDKNYRQCRYGTIAHISCSGNQSRETLSETLKSVNK